MLSMRTHLENGAVWESTRSNLAALLHAARQAIQVIGHARAQLDDQGLVNADPRNIAVPDGFVNMIPTDIRGITFARTPQQVLCPPSPKAQAPADV